MVSDAKKIAFDCPRSIRSIASIAVLALGIIVSAPRSALADEGGVSFWLPGFFGSLAAAPQQPGWSLTSIYYHTSVSAGADVARAREFEIGRIPITATANVSASLDARADLALALPAYTVATPVFGGQLTVGAIGIYGRESTSLAGTVTGALATPLGTLPFSRFDSISDSVTGFGDVLPIATLRWNNGVHNYMTYITGDIPVGAYDSTRLSNIGIGHGAIDAGGGYTYLNPQTGHEFTGVLGFTYNFTNQSTQYQNGVDMHFDWGASQFLTKQFLVGAVGYVYKEVGCDSGSGDRVGFASRRRRSAARSHYSPEHHDAGLPQSQKLLGIRPRQPARRLERLGDLRHLAGGSDAGRSAATNDHEIVTP